MPIQLTELTQAVTLVYFPLRLGDKLLVGKPLWDKESHSRWEET